MDDFGRQFIGHKLAELSAADETESSGVYERSPFDIGAYKQAISVADDQLSIQKSHLQKVKRALKAHCSAGKQFVNSGAQLAEALEKYAALCTQQASANPNNRSTTTCESELSLVVFANALKELSALLSSLMQSATNMTVFPLRNLLKVEVRSRNDAKRACEKACKQYELQLEKIRKERLPDDAEREKRHLEVQICDFLGRNAEFELKRNVELLEHLSEYAFAIRAFHRDAQEKAVRSADQLATFQDGLQRRRQEFEKRRREFSELRDRLVALGGDEYFNGTLQRGTLPRQTPASMPCSPAQQQTANANATGSGKYESRHMLSSISSGSQLGLSGLGLSLPMSGSESSSMRNSAPFVTISRSEEPLGQERTGDDKKLMQKSGYLLKRSEGKLKMWQKRRVEVRDGALWLYHADEMEDPVCVSLLTSQFKLVGSTAAGAPASPSPVAVAAAAAAAAESETVTSATGSAIWKSANANVAGRFDIYSCAQNRRYHFQVQADDVNAELNEWITVISNVRKEALERSFVRASIGKQRMRSVTYSSATGGALLTAAIQSERSLTKRLIEFVRNTPGNSTCCDCDAPNPEWLSTNLGVLICLECCGVHRELGVHISRTQSLVIDELSAPQLLVAFAIGNRMFNSVFEAALSNNGTTKPRADSPIVPVRRDFIRAKYDRRAFVEKLVADSEATQVIDSELLRSALVRSDAAEVLKTFAQNRSAFGVELNETGESAVHLLIQNYPQPHASADQRDPSSRAALDALCLFEFVMQNTPVRLHDRTNSTIGKVLDSVLHYAVRENKPDCLRALLRQRPDLLQPVVNANQSGSQKLIDSLIELAKKPDRLLCLELLEKAVNRTANSDTFDSLPDGFWSLLLGNDGPSEQRSTSVNRSKTWVMRDSPNAGTNVVSSDRNYDQMPLDAAATLRVCKPRTSSQTHLQTGTRRGVTYRYSTPLDLRDGNNRGRMHDCDIDEAVDHLDVILDVVSETLERSRTKRSAADSDSASTSASLSSSTRSSDRFSQHLTATRPAAGHKVITLYGCTADQDDELTFLAGETIIIAEHSLISSERDEDDQWAYGYVEAAPTRRGLFPLNFVKPLEPETFF